MKNFCVKGLYSSEMVLQRNAMNCICGEGAEEEVCLDFCNTTIKTMPDQDGNWKIEFMTGEAGGPYDLSVTSGINQITYHNVYLGEVWLSSGQSNAQLPMNRLRFSYSKEVQLPENPNVRMITVPISYSFGGEKSTVDNPCWKVACPENILDFSGTAYFFAKKMSAELKVPVGIINASQGGSPVYAWMNEESLSKFKNTDYIDRLYRWRKPGEVETVKAQVGAAQKKWDEAIIQLDKGFMNNWASSSTLMDNWKDFSLPGDFTELGEKGGSVWFKKEIELSTEDLEKIGNKKLNIWMGTIQDADQVYVNDVFCGATYYTYPPRRYFIPEGTLKVGKNIITLRIQKNGIGAIRFYEEKPYVIFSEDVVVHPVAYRNVELPLSLLSDSNSPLSPLSENPYGFYLYLEGNWKYAIGCELELRPGEMFFEWEPTALFNSMLAPAFNHSIAGVLWYQGESNAHESEAYKSLLKEMMALWRNKFIYAKNNLPFVLMQLPNWADGYRDESLWNFGDWANMRNNVIEIASEDKNCTSVSMIDAGEWNDLHPEKKLTGGTRAACEALRLVYGKDFSFAPKIIGYEETGNKLILSFDCDKSKLVSYKVEDERIVLDSSDSKVYGFEFIFKNDSKNKVCGTLVSENKVEVALPENKKDLKELRYLWSNNPWIVNLYSAEGIPTNPFKLILDK